MLFKIEVSPTGDKYFVKTNTEAGLDIGYFYKDGIGRYYFWMRDVGGWSHEALKELSDHLAKINSQTM